jgi:large subunit ribosomal protein L25
MSAVKQLKASARASVGKGAARAVRRNGQVPAVIYGAGEAALPIALDAAQANRLVYAGHFLTTVFEIEVDGKTHRAIPRDYQLDPVKDTVEHVDFLRLAEGGKIKVSVPIHFDKADQSKAIKAGGVLNVVRHEVELYVPADDIPEAINVDVSGLDFGDTLRISAAGLKASYQPVITDRDFVLATLQAPKTGGEEPAPTA